MILPASYIGAGEVFGLGGAEDEQLSGAIIWVPDRVDFLQAGLALARVIPTAAGPHLLEALLTSPAG